MISFVLVLCVPVVLVLQLRQLIQLVSLLLVELWKDDLSGNWIIKAESAIRPSCL